MLTRSLRKTIFVALSGLLAVLGACGGGSEGTRGGASRSGDDLGPEKPAYAIADSEPEFVSGYSLHSTFCKQAFAEAFGTALVGGDVTAAGSGDRGRAGAIDLDGQARTREFAPRGERHKRLHIPESADLVIRIASQDGWSTWDGTHRASIEHRLSDTERGTVVSLQEAQCRHLADQVVEILDERLGAFRVD